MRLRLANEGQPGANGGPHGDLFVFLKVKPHAFFERHEQDLHCTIPLNMAQAALGADRPDNALAWLNLNLEFYPKSSRTYQIMAQLHQKKNDKDAAIKDLEKAVEMDPNNAQAKAQLQQLKGQ